MSEKNITDKTDEKPNFVEKSEEVEADPTMLHQQKVDRLLASLKPGQKVSIFRERPAWAKSFLERIEILDGDDIDLDYLAETWGGDVLRLRVCDQNGTYRGGVDVPFRSYPPKFRGVPMSRNGIDAEDLPKGAKVEPNIIQVSTPQQPQNNLEQILSLLKQTRSEDLKTFKSLLDTTTTDPPSIGNGIQNIVELANQIKELQGVFGGAEASLSAPAGNDQSALFQTIGEVAKALLAKPQAAATVQPRLVQHPRERPARAPANQGPGVNLAAALAEMPPDQAADVAFAALARMPPQKKEQAITEIISRLGSEDDLDFDEDDDLEGDDEQGGDERHPDASESID